ncbi:U-box domain-containing protein 33-like [Rutidosis leptorrhynchoides]|uniref:U-box domain-containing protein 33-like n=1 Tax=Rutidosis leptorrhynchoides TaxID=125765 RepID=UPI003A9937AB
MENAQRINQILYPLIDTSEDIIEIRDEIVHQTGRRSIEDKVYVAVGTDLKDCRSTLLWALQNSGGRQICILHVHQPAQSIPSARQVTAYQEMDREDMHQLLDKYKQICQDTGVRAEVQYIEMEYIEKGIVDFILQHNVRRLVMGAATADTQNSRMVELRSKKAVYVCLHAAASCQIQFICKGEVIFTRKGWLSGVDELNGLIPLNTKTDSRQSFLRSASVSTNTDSFFFFFSTISQGDYPLYGQPGVIAGEPPGRPLSTPPPPTWLTNTDSSQTSPSSTSVSEGLQVLLHPDNPTQDDGTMSRIDEDIQNVSPFSVIEKGINELYDQLVQAMEDLDKSKRDAFEESIKCRKAQKDAIEAKRMASISENLYVEELGKRREVEEKLEKTMEELNMALEQKSILESQNADFVDIVHELEQAVFSNDDQLQIYKKERDELKVKCDDAVRLVEELTEKHEEDASSSNVFNFYSEFESTEVKNAIGHFDPSLKIGEGSFESTYKGLLRHTEVVVKVFYDQNFQVSSKYQQEVNLLSKLRHPNVVTLIGACPDDRMIIYEYLSGGNLEDRLDCKDNTPSLSWQNRIRIATELCSVLIFLHSCGVVHGNLKPKNILLDKNLVTKLSSFGIHHQLSLTEVLSNNNASLYMDPACFFTGEFTVNSDAYSFGVILLRLLTGKPTLGLTYEVRLALNNDTLKNILDSTAGDWPFVLAQRLAVLAMSCCDFVTTNRPDFETGIWRVIEPIRASCGLCSFSLGSEGRRDIPHYFVCPIFQDTMEDPVVAADGFTYEAEAIKGWLDSGHNTSPMTNLELANTNLVPNHALRSAIQEWLQQP